MTYVPLRNLPDVDDVVLEILRAGGISCGPDNPPDILAVVPYVVARRYGGAAVDPEHLDRALVQVDAYAVKRRDAADLAETCRVLLYNAWLTQTVYSAGHVTRFAEITAPSKLQTADEPDNLNRYHATYTLHVH